jgi:hypothetical protein
MGPPQVRLLDGSTFVVSDGAGDFGAADDLDGLFYRDVRHLSHWQVLVNGAPMRQLPSAWASAAPLLFIRVMLGLDPSDGGLTVDPQLPSPVQRLALSAVPVRDAESTSPADRRSSGRAGVAVHP